MSTLSRIGRLLKPEGLKKRARLLRTLLVSRAVHDEETMHLVYSWSSGTLSRVPLETLFPGIDSCGSVVIRKPESRTIGWSLDLQELVHLLTIIRFTGAKQILEIGTFDGFTALNVAANLDDGGQISTVDLPQERQEFEGTITNLSDARIVGVQYRGEKEETRIKQLWADSTTTDWTTFGSRFDLILVDACHEYPYVKSDSLNAIRHVRPGGVVIWHDYGFIPDVSRAVDEIALEHPVVAIKGTRLACYCRPAA